MSLLPFAPQHTCALKLMLPRRLTVRGTVVPVLCGASLHGIGVEPLLDAITAYLPSPAERSVAQLWPADLLQARGRRRTPADETAIDEGVSAEHVAAGVALAFKVQHEAHSKKPLVWMRMYHGQFRRGDVLTNPRTGATEKLTRLLQIHGAATTELDQARAHEPSLLVRGAM